jgi:hypothetical protein
LREALAHIRSQRQGARELGYLAGAALVIEGYLDDHHTFELLAKHNSVRDTAVYLNTEYEGTSPIVARIFDMAEAHHDLIEPQKEGQGAWVSWDFIEGISAALHDLWEAAEAEAGAAE